MTVRPAHPFTSPAASAIQFEGVQLLTRDPSPAACLPVAHDLIDLTAGSDVWETPLVSTAPVVGLRDMVQGTWLGHSGWNPLLDHASQHEQPPAPCPGERAYRAHFALDATQLLCLALRLEVVAQGRVTVTVRLCSHATEADADCARLASVALHALHALHVLHVLSSPLCSTDGRMPPPHRAAC